MQLTATSNGCLDQTVELFITTDGQLQMTRRDTLHFQIFASITSQFQYLMQTTVHTTIMY